jgi:hypothetical protein
MPRKIKLYRGEFHVLPEHGKEYPCCNCSWKGKDFYVVPKKTLRAGYYSVFCVQCHENEVRRWTRENHGLTTPLSSVKVSRGGSMRVPAWQLEEEVET